MGDDNRGWGALVAIATMLYFDFVAIATMLFFDYVAAAAMYG